MDTSIIRHQTPGQDKPQISDYASAPQRALEFQQSSPNTTTKHYGENDDGCLFSTEMNHVREPVQSDGPHAISTNGALLWTIQDAGFRRPPRTVQPPQTVDEVLAKALTQLGIVDQEWFPATWFRRVTAGDSPLSVQRRNGKQDRDHHRQRLKCGEK